MKSLEPIASLLAQHRALPEPLLRRAQNEAKTRAGFLGRVLALGVPEPDLVAIVAEQLGIPGVDLSRTLVDLDVIDTIPRIVAESDLVLPLSTEGGRLHVAVSAGAEDHEVIEELHFITGLEVSPYAALPGVLEQAIAAAYDAKDRGERFWRGPGLLPDAEATVAVILPGNRPGVLTRPRTEEIYDDTRELEEMRGDDVSLEVGEDEDDVEVLSSIEVRVGPAHILVVDDDNDILRLLDKTLRAAGHEVELARDGREAETKLKTTRYDLVLLDAMLPFVHGFEICARLKASARTRRLPVILLSAVYRGWRYAHDARESFGADDYIEKPFHLPELLRRARQRQGGEAVSRGHGAARRQEACRGAHRAGEGGEGRSLLGAGAVRAGAGDARAKRHLPRHHRVRARHRAAAQPLPGAPRGGDALRAEGLPAEGGRVAGARAARGARRTDARSAARAADQVFLEPAASSGTGTYTATDTCTARTLRGTCHVTRARATIACTWT